MALKQVSPCCCMRNSERDETSVCVCVCVLVCGCVCRSTNIAYEIFLRVLRNKRKLKKENYLVLFAIISTPITSAIHYMADLS